MRKDKRIKDDPKYYRLLGNEQIALELGISKNIVIELNRQAMRKLRTALVENKALGDMLRSYL